MLNFCVAFLKHCRSHAFRGCLAASFLTFSISQPLMAGGWVGSGGDFVRDQDNPWFFNNREVIKYCILADLENFGLNIRELRSSISAAIGFWKAEFAANGFLSLEEYGEIKVGQNRWQEMLCTNEEASGADVVFQFGVISEGQKEFFKKNFSNPLAGTIRKSYNRKTLVGTGSIIIASPNQANKLPLTFWQVNDQFNLILTLIHELGHVYGLKHTGTGTDIMAEGFVESISLQNSPMLATKYEELSFFKLPTKRDIKIEHEQIRHLPIQDFKSAFSLQFSKELALPEDIFPWSPPKLMILNRDGLDLGSCQLKVSRASPVGYNYLWITPEQKIFSKKDVLSQSIRGRIELGALQKTEFFCNIDDSWFLVEYEQGRSEILISGSEKKPHHNWIWTL